MGTGWLARLVRFPSWNFQRFGWQRQMLQEPLPSLASGRGLATVYLHICIISTNHQWIDCSGLPMAFKFQLHGSICIKGWIQNLACGVLQTIGSQISSKMFENDMKLQDQNNWHVCLFQSCVTKLALEVVDVLFVSFNLNSRWTGTRHSSSPWISLR